MSVPGAARALRFVVPAGLDDPARVSGGNVYDREVRDGLGRHGWAVRTAEAAEAEQVAEALDGLPSGGVALVDGLVAGWAPAAVESAARRGHPVVLAHMVASAFPGATADAVEAERRTFRAAAGVIATSRWTAAELVRRGFVERSRVIVAVPGSHERPPAVGPVGHRDLLCVGVLAPHKGQDVLLDALAQVDGDWTLTLAGSRATDPAFAARVAVAAEPFGQRVRLPGVLDGGDLDRAHRRVGVLVAPSRAESFGMAIVDARRRGMPVIATEAGGIPEAVAGGGAILVPPGDADALADALRRWMTDPALRARLRIEALRARALAPRWADTVARVDEALVAA
ncbi:glycosyltransferase family 4 protein [Pseudolysinimonas kribbensis]|uniref:Glycosyl transferase n=1 Tax=Pseudolysinimonas kribbensis TaxID=433641 RepID=A0ABQ6K4J1_9MICO|nr:glycosyltransferase family 4 protein [Pseudolysinimonas kribbensis]GMA95546.1 glycosyl transferase [Pseudolysinimonas kribbensis]